MPWDRGRLARIWPYKLFWWRFYLSQRGGRDARGPKVLSRLGGPTLPIVRIDDPGAETAAVIAVVIVVNQQI
jgi:hypothetical protein